MKHLPNIITLLRLLLIPVIIFLLSEPGVWRIVSLFLFTLCSISDWLDGFLARKWNVQSTFGQFLDPLVDKFLILGMFVAFTYADPTVFPFWLVWLIGIREFVVTMIRVNGVYEHKNVSTKISGKVKTVAQFVAIFIIYALLIIKDQVALNMDKFTRYIHSTMDGSLPLWKYLFGVYGTKFILILPTIALTVVVVFTLYSGILYIIEHKSFFLGKES